ncbi:MAG TPA: transporter substrate-binding domain-containing protein [Ignavibacteriales bacterium]|nr:transporter substrate-binding domain-containing protein [Ignavibacteriales bacterium]
MKKRLLKPKSSRKASLRKEITKKKSAQKTSPRTITVVMENYPPNCYIENLPKVISENEFRNSFLKKMQNKSQRDLLSSAYRLDRQTGRYYLSGNADAADLEKLKEVLFSQGILKLTGFEIEISREIFSKLGLKPEYRVYPWARCIEMMKSGSSDCILTIFKNSERMKYLYYPSEFTVDQPNALFKLKESRIAFDGDLRKLKGQLIGVKISTSYGGNFDRANFLKKEQVSFTEAVISLVENKRVSLGVGSITQLKYLMNQRGIAGKFEFLNPLVSQEHLYIAFSRARKHKKLSEQFAANLARFKKTEKYKKILKKYGIANS